MKVEQIYTGCLAQGAYYIESNGEAVVIDPLREVEPYIRKAEASNAKIKYVFETHFHADFVSGHLDLAKETGATIVYGPTAQPAFDAYVAHDGESFKLGNIHMVVLHTPGHTPGGICLYAEGQLFTGDTLFVGDSGRTDLPGGHRPTLGASIRRLMELPEETIVWPGHDYGPTASSTIGWEKRHNVNAKEYGYYVP